MVRWGFKLEVTVGTYVLDEIFVDFVSFAADRSWVVSRDVLGEEVVISFAEGISAAENTFQGIYIHTLIFIAYLAMIRVQKACSS